MDTLGIMDLVWLGRKLEVEEGSSIRIGGIRRVPVNVGRRTHTARQYQETEVTAVIPLKSGERVGDIWIDGIGELQVICDTGQTFVMNDAAITSDRPTFTGGEGGKAEIKWSASAPEEIGV